MPSWSLAARGFVLEGWKILRRDEPPRRAARQLDEVARQVRLVEVAAGSGDLRDREERCPHQSAGPAEADPPGPRAAGTPRPGRRRGVRIAAGSGRSSPTAPRPEPFPP